MWLLGPLPLACGPHADQSGDRPPTLVLAYCCGDRVFSPQMDANARLLLFLPLADHDERGELRGRLARSWSHSQDYREWTFHLRTDVFWHDGVPVTAHDVVFTIDLWAHPDVRWYGAAGVESAEALDDSTVVVRHRRPTDALRYQPWLVYFPRHLLEGLEPGDFHDWEFWSRPVGNGPYRYVRTVPGTLIELEASESFYLGKPPIERVILRFVDGAGPAELLSGGVDVLTDVEPDQAHQLADDPRFTLSYSASTDTGLAIYWNHRSPLLADAEVRRALTVAVDRRELRSVLGFPDKVPILDGPTSLRQRARGQLPPPIPHDAREAARLLEAAGWRDTDGDGIRDRAGRPFRLTMIVAADQPAFREVGVYVQERLRRMGIDVGLVELDGGVAFQRVEDGEFEAAVRTTGIPSDWLARYFGPGSRLGYDSPDARRLVRQLDSVADPLMRDRIYGELTELFQREAPALFLFPSIRFVLYTHRLQGLSSPWRAEPTRHMDELRLEPVPR